MMMASSLMMFGAAVLFVLAIAAALAPTISQRRLSRLGATPLDEDGSELAADHGLYDQGQGWMVRALAPLAGRQGQEGSEGFKHLRTRLMQAGYRSPGAVTVYLGSRVLLVALLPAIAWFSPIRGLVEARFELLLPIAALAIGFVGPSLWLDIATRRRQDAIDRDMPPVLDLMVVSIEAGLGLMQALTRVGAEFRRAAPILAEEIELVTLESRAGKSNADALRGLAQRTGVREVSVLVAMLMQTERFGTSLAGALRIHCDTMRANRMRRAEEQAAKAPLKMIFPTALILVSLLLLIMGLAGLRAKVVLGL